MDPLLDIPDFLKLTKEQRRAAWKDFKPTVPMARDCRRRRVRWDLPRSIDEEGLAIFRAQERATAAKKAEKAKIAAQDRKNRAHLGKPKHAARLRSKRT